MVGFRLSRSPSRPAALLAVVFAIALFACRSAVPAGVPAEAAPSAHAVDGVPAGSAIAVRRPTRGVALLSLWIDAGARDATPPQLATVAAWWAAERAGAEARVLPEGTELRVLCVREREGIGACARRLQSALGVEAPNETQLAPLRARLRAARQRTASDVVRHAQQLALHGLLGDAAQGLAPLGRDEDDAQLSAAAVGNFLGRHYGPSRSILLGLGDVTKDELARASGKRPSLTPRANRSVVLAAGALRVELGSTNQIALVVPSASVPEAASLAERFRAVHPLATASISNLRGATLTHLDLPGGELPFARLQAALFDVRRLQREAQLQPPLPPPDTLDELARQIGEQWIARGGRNANGEAIGVGLVLARDPHAVDDGDAALAKARERAQAAVDAGKNNSLGTTRGTTNGQHVQVTGENGTRIALLRRTGDAWFAAAIRFAGGSALDPPTAHGRAALLATLLADGCAFSSERSLDVRLTQMQAKLTPLVDADGVGVMVSAPMAQAEQALDVLLRCAVRPTFSARGVEDARARLLKTLWSREATLLHATLAHAVSPAAPGRVAPWGTPEGLAKVEPTDLKRLHAQRAVGRGTSLWLIADRAPEQLLAFAARRLAHLPSTTASDPASQLGPYGEIDGSLIGSTRLRVVVGVRSTTGDAGSDAAQVFADALRGALEKRTGQGIWSWGESSAGLSSAGVALTLREDQLDGLLANTQAALREIGSRPEATFAAALEGAFVSRSLPLASARGWVEAAFHGRETPTANGARDLALIRKLAAEKPTFFVLRPRP